LTDIKVTDNFLDKEYFTDIQGHLLGPNFPWFFNDGINYDFPPHPTQYQLIHIFYDNGNELPYFQLIGDMCRKIGYKEILDDPMRCGIKGNMNPRQPEHEMWGFHIDLEPGKTEGWTTSIFHVNTNNGWTEFESGDKIDCVGNRLISFPSHIQHSGVSCTDVKRRVVINMNGKL
tara:strand:- start:1049 stop:1570 length:522 start_codon:yes stop_codon:yes gene_type:complete